jgi:hypothetical protein
MSSTNLAIVESPALALPAPIYGGPAMAQALIAYRELQRALDQSMPDQILDLGGRQFRKKGYWRALSVAFNLSVDLVEERREVHGQFDDGRENFGYVVVCRATAPNGRTAVGDGSVFAIEKARRDVGNKWAALPAQASEHNVRSHAVTRAYNRAVSNLVGFGEVSAEEADEAEAPARERKAPARTLPTPEEPRTVTVKISKIVKRQLDDGVRQKFIITAYDDLTYHTFSLTVATAAKAAQEAGAVVQIRYVETKYGRMIESLSEVDARPEPVL